jgi:hypothetical protein
MPLTIPCTAMFRDAYEAFDDQKRKTILKKVRLLVECPLSSALNAHRYDTLYNVWVCYIDHRMRLLYERLDGVLHLRNVGYHAMLDKAGRCSDASYVYLLNLDEEWQDLCCSSTHARVKKMRGAI